MKDMTVKQLIEELQKLPNQDAKVVLIVEEDGGVLYDVSTMHPSGFYYKGDCPVGENEDAVALVAHY